MSKPKRKHRSPRIVIDVTPARWNLAVASASGGCLIADAMKADYPELTQISVNAATIRASNPKENERYTWITPPAAAELLLSYDQGWAEPADHRFVLNGAVKVTRLRGLTPARRRSREERLAELEQKEANSFAGAETLSTRERQALTKLRATPPNDRPNAFGPVTDVVENKDGSATVVGGPPLKTNPTNPNLLSGRDRHFAQKLAQPSEVFRLAVETQVQQRLAELAEVAEDASGATTPPPNRQPTV